MYSIVITDLTFPQTVIAIDLWSTTPPEISLLHLYILCLHHYFYCFLNFPRPHHTTLPMWWSISWSQLYNWWI